MRRSAIRRLNTDSADGDSGTKGAPKLHVLLSIYNAGPEVFMPNGGEIFRRKSEICLRHNIVAKSPLVNGADLGAPDASVRIYRQNREMMLGCDAIIANLTPFRGPSADDGTAFELGFFDALRRPAFGYSNVCGSLAERTQAFLRMVPDPTPLAVEDFGLSANLMLPHAVLDRGGLPIFLPEDGIDRGLEDIATFERLVIAIARRCRCVARLRDSLAAILGSPDAAAECLRRPHPKLDWATPLEAVIARPSQEGWVLELLGRPEDGGI